MSKNKLFVCECGSIEHQVILTHNKKDNELYLSIHLTNYRNIFKRIIVAIKYIFCYKCKYGNLT